jgi:predicted N-acetyltransferase YhbS
MTVAIDPNRQGENRRFRIFLPIWPWAIIAPGSCFKMNVRPSMIKLLPLHDVRPADVETLLDAAFGADRQKRTAYRMREGVLPIPELSFAACDETGLIGTLQSWPVALIDDDGQCVPLTLVGPVAVKPDLQRGGVGKLLMSRLIDAAKAERYDALIMIGDPEYYERFFGFSATETQGWELPGPFERHRLLARIQRPGGVPAFGRIIPDPAFASEALSA